VSNGFRLPARIGLAGPSGSACNGSSVSRRTLSALVEPPGQLVGTANTAGADSAEAVASAATAGRDRPWHIFSRVIQFSHRDGLAPLRDARRAGRPFTPAPPPGRGKGEGARGAGTRSVAQARSGIPFGDEEGLALPGLAP
jgi:hypothetical protein